MSTNTITVTTIDGETLSGVLYRTRGFVNSEILADTLKRNPHLVYLPLKYPAETEIIISTAIQEEKQEAVQTLW